ncbi:MAG: hypothetical protein ACI4CZ_04335 [Hominisplanchenecus sp.]
MSDYARNRGRMAIYAMAGVYLLFMAYNMFKSIPTSSGNEKILLIVFMVLFTIIGGAMVIMGMYLGYKMTKEGSAPAADEEDSDSQAEIAEANAAGIVNETADHDRTEKNMDAERQTGESSER